MSYRSHSTAVGVGAFIATVGGQALHLYAPGEPAGFIGSVVGAVVLALGSEAFPGCVEFEDLLIDGRRYFFCTLIEAF